MYGLGLWLNNEHKTETYLKRQELEKLWNISWWYHYLYNILSYQCKDSFFWTHQKFEMHSSNNLLFHKNPATPGKLEKNSQKALFHKLICSPFRRISIDGSLTSLSKLSVLKLCFINLISRISRNAHLSPFGNRRYFLCKRWGLT